MKESWEGVLGEGAGEEEELVKGKGRRRLMTLGLKGKERKMEEDLDLGQLEVWISGRGGLDSSGRSGTSTGLSTSLVSSVSGSSSADSSCARGSGRGAKRIRRVEKCEFVADGGGEDITALGAVRAVMVWEERE